MQQPDLSQLLERGAARPQSPGDVDRAWQRGQSRRRRKRAALAAGSAMAIIAAGTLVTTLWQRPPAPTIQPGPDETDRWGPLAVVPGEPSGDRALIHGTLRITDECAMLYVQGDQLLLVWPAQATTWNADQRTITYTNRDGSTVELRDGTPVAFGGGELPKAVNGIDWTSAPAPECMTETQWRVSDGNATASHLTLPNLTGLPLAEAQGQLEDLGLRGEPASGDPTDPDAVIVHHEPPAGALVPHDAVVGFRTALITPALCDVFTDVPQRQGDAHALARADGYWDMLERAEPVAPPHLAQHIRTLLDFHETGQPLEQAPTQALDRVTTHHDACHAQQ